jgi:hypothetical protein
MHFGTFAFLVPIKAGSRSTSGVDCTVRLSKITALGSAFRSNAIRNTARKSCAIASKHPALIQRCVCW